MNKQEKNKYRIIKSNILIESRYKLNITEMKLFLYMVKQVSIDDTDFKKYKIYIKDFVNDADIKHTEIYTYALQIARQFRKKEIELIEPDGVVYAGFLASVKRFNDNRSYLEYTFAPELIPHLLRLKKHFTSYDIRNVLNCKSVHSIRLYQLMKEFEYKENSTFSINELKYILACDNSYNRYVDFRRYVIDTARAELKKFSDIYFDYKPIKQGRKVVSVKFIIKKQKQRRLFDGKPEPSANDAMPLTNYQKDITGLAVAEGNRLLDSEVVPLSQSGLQR